MVKGEHKGGSTMNPGDPSLTPSVSGDAAQSVGVLAAQARKHLFGVTQKALAGEARLSVSTIKRIERGTCEADGSIDHLLGALQRLAERQARSDVLALVAEIRDLLGTQKRTSLTIVGTRETRRLIQLTALRSAMRDACGILERLLLAGHDTTHVQKRISDLRRQLRAGGRLSEGDRIGERFTLISKLGSGAIATVWKAMDQAANHRLLALKVLHGHYCDHEPTVQQFRAASRLARRLKHKYITEVFDEAIEAEGFWVIPMELVNGSTLDRLVANNSLHLESWVRIIVDVCSAIEYIHSEGFVHRDIKPTNILIDEYGKPKVSDFDLAIGHDVSMLSVGGLGSLPFAAPELLANPNARDPRIDIFGLGMVSAFCCFGRPLPLTAYGRAEFIRQLTAPARLIRTLICATELEPSHRTATISAFASDLRDSLNDISSPLASATSERVPQFSQICGRTFSMGSPASEDGRFEDETEHERRLSHEFAMQTTPVTQAQWQCLMVHNPSVFKGPDLPVHRVCWFDAIEYCNRLSESVGLPPAYREVGSAWSPGQAEWKEFSEPDVHAATGYRLPTEAEWEFACRGAVPGPHYAPLSRIAIYWQNSGGMVGVVGKMEPNAYGLYDMLGNVWEWCWDEYGPYEGGQPSLDPIRRLAALKHGMISLSAIERVVRGGAWGYDSRFIRAAMRGHGSPHDLNDFVGFRVARTLVSGGNAQVNERLTTVFRAVQET